MFFLLFFILLSPEIVFCSLLYYLKYLGINWFIYMKDFYMVSFYKVILFELSFSNAHIVNILKIKINQTMSGM